jgi:chloramphenicol-sensitive protein RarD
MPFRGESVRGIMAETKGAWYTTLAYTLWGFFPIYWKFLAGISALQLTCHRIVWSSVFLFALVARSKDRQALLAAIRAPRVIGLYAAAAVTIAFNWLIFVLAVNVGELVQTSLGYFISPLLSVVLGVLVFGERLRRPQWISVGFATAGVLYLTLAVGTLPWIGLLLAGSFAAYGLLKKSATLTAVQGLALETSILLLPAAVYLVSAEIAGRGALLHSGLLRDALMVVAGPVTTVPLLLFAAGVRRISLSLVGMLQYISPTMQLLIATLVYREPFTRVQLTGFALVWAALAVFAVEGYLTRRWPQLGVTDVT